MPPAVARAGAVAAPLNSAYTLDEFKFFMEDADSQLAIVPPLEGEGIYDSVSVGLVQNTGGVIVDIDEQRVGFAREQGYCEAARLDESNLKERVETFSGGNGADSVIISTSPKGPRPV